MLQFKVAEAILEKRAGYRDCTIGQDGDDPTIRKLLSKFHGNSEIDFRKNFQQVQPIRESLLPESPCKQRSKLSALFDAEIVLIGQSEVNA